jgi:hypothetical protein
MHRIIPGSVSPRRTDGEYFLANLPLYFKQYIESDYCMTYVLSDGDLIIGIVTAIVVPSIGTNSISITVLFSYLLTVATITPGLSSS